MSSVEDADNAVGTRARTLAGRLRVFAPVSIGRIWVVPRLTAFLEMHPGIEVELVLDDRPRDLIEERLDIAIRVGELPLPQQHLQKLGDVQRIVVAAPGYWQAYGIPTMPAALAEHHSLIFAGTITLDRVTMQRDGKLADVELHGRFRTNSSEAIEEAALQGHGVLVGPTWLTRRHIASGRLTQVLDDWRVVPPLAISLAYPETRMPSEKVSRFADWLARSLQEDHCFD